MAWKRINVDEMKSFKKQVIKIFQKFGLSNPHALISANALINAELVGAYGHGYQD